MSGVEAKEITWQAVLKHMDWATERIAAGGTVPEEAWTTLGPSHRHRDRRAGMGHASGRLALDSLHALVEDGARVLSSHDTKAQALPAVPAAAYRGTS